MAGPGKCRECGAGLVAGSATCPLCGTLEGTASNKWLGDAPEKAPIAGAEATDEDGPDRDSYYASIQSLRSELTKLRKRAS